MCMFRLAYAEDQKHLSQYDPAIDISELHRREAENAERDRQDNIREALAYIGCLEPILDELKLYWHGGIRDLKATLESMQT